MILLTGCARSQGATRLNGLTRALTVSAGI
jgi:hypothetical protein